MGLVDDRRGLRRAGVRLSENSMCLLRSGQSSTCLNPCICTFESGCKGGSAQSHRKTLIESVVNLIYALGRAPSY